MGETTAISWADATFNPWWGCQRVSPGCEHCYAETFAKRYGHDVWGPTSERRLFADAHWGEPVKWDRGSALDVRRGAHRRRVFCASMADVFEDRRDLDASRARLFALMDATPNLDWLVLTKRPGNVNAMVPSVWLVDWPAWVWLGATVENQDAAAERIPLLLDTPAAVRFLSCEPLLGPVSLAAWLPIAYSMADQCWQREIFGHVADRSGLHWVITGGESGGPLERRLVTHLGDRMSGEIWTLKPEARDWLRAIRDQCAAANVAFFHKQNGGPTNKAGGRLLDGREYNAWPDVTTPATRAATR